MQRWRSRRRRAARWRDRSAHSLPDQEWRCIGRVEGLVGASGGEAPVLGAGSMVEQRLAHAPDPRRARRRLACDLGLSSDRTRPIASTQAAASGVSAAATVIQLRPETPPGARIEGADASARRQRDQPRALQRGRDVDQRRGATWRRAVALGAPARQRPAATAASSSCETSPPARPGSAAVGLPRRSRRPPPAAARA